MRLAKVLRIARWEVLKGTETVDRRTVAGAVLAVAMTAALGAAISGAGVAHDAGLYRVGVAADSPYHGPASEDPTFVVREPDPAALDDGLDLVVVDGEVAHADTRKGRAALAAFRRAVVRYNDRRMAAEANASAAFPLHVSLRYTTRSMVASGGTGQDGTSGDGGSAGGRTVGGTDDDPGSVGGGALSGPQVAGQPLLSSTQEGDPSAIEPPLPLGALFLAFLFVVPMNFVVQAYGASLLRERMDRRGELLLVAPVSPLEIVAGKTLPYFLAIVGVAAVTAVGVEGGPLSLAAVVPLGLLFLSATFAAAMFARSFKELTFLTVTISVVVTSYAFVPAVFTEVTPIALISPLTLVVRDLLAESVTLGEYAFSTGPFYLSSAVLFLLGAGVYREEDLFSQRPVHLKALDALASRVRGVGSVGLLTVAFIPFVLVGELLAVALLFALPLGLSLPLLLLAVATVEELAKSAHVYAAYHHRLFDRTPSAPVAVGAASGLGFFLGEKLTLVARIVQLPDLPLGRAAFAQAAALDGAPLVVLLVAPLALHVTTATISALGASRGPRWYLGAYGVAVVVHVAYNLGVVSYVA